MYKIKHGIKIHTRSTRRLKFNCSICQIKQKSYRRRRLRTFRKYAAVLSLPRAMPSTCGKNSLARKRCSRQQQQQHNFYYNSRISLCIMASRPVSRRRGDHHQNINNNNSSMTTVGGGSASDPFATTPSPLGALRPVTSYRCGLNNNLR